MDVTAFVFDARLDPERDFIARIPRGVSSREALFDVLSRELRLPSYFGRNWDALSDSLRDLSWITKRRVVLIHDELPKLGDEDLANYLAVLVDAARDWKPDEAHELVVVFPKDAQQALSRFSG